MSPRWVRKVGFNPTAASGSLREKDSFSFFSLPNHEAFHTDHLNETRLFSPNDYS